MTCWDYLGGWILPHVTLPCICHGCQWPRLSAGQNSVDSDLGNCDESWSMVDLPIESVGYKYIFVSVNNIQRYKGRLFEKLLLQDYSYYFGTKYTCKFNIFTFAKWWVIYPTMQLKKKNWFDFDMKYDLLLIVRVSTSDLTFSKMFSLQHSILQWLIIYHNAI